MSSFENQKYFIDNCTKYFLYSSEHTVEAILLLSESLKMCDCNVGQTISDSLLQQQHLSAINKTAHKNVFPEGTQPDKGQSLQFLGNQSASLVQLQKTAVQMELVT